MGYCYVVVGRFCQCDFLARGGVNNLFASAAIATDNIPRPVSLRFRRPRLARMSAPTVGDGRCRMFAARSRLYLPIARLLLSASLSSVSIRCRRCWRKEDPLQAEGVFLGAPLCCLSWLVACTHGVRATVHARWGGLGSPLGLDCREPSCTRLIERFIPTKMHTARKWSLFLCCAPRNVPLTPRPKTMPPPLATISQRGSSLDPA